MNQLIRPAKQVLVKRYGYQNVSVKNGSGTAWGWVEVRITTNKPTTCTGNNPFYCTKCKEHMNQISTEATKLMYTAWQKLGLKPYTYCSDDGYNTDSAEVLIQISFI